MASILAFSPHPTGRRDLLRHRIERALEEALDTAARLIAFLDALDGDHNAEVATAWGAK